MRLMQKPIVSQIIAGIVTAVIIGIGVIVWQEVTEGGLVRALGGVSVADLGEGERKWHKVGYDRSHADRGDWCPRRQFIRQLNLDGCDRTGACPVVGEAFCCTLSSQAR